MCNLGSINIGNYFDSDQKSIQWDKLARNVQIAVVFLNRIIDINFYPGAHFQKIQQSLAPHWFRADGSLQDLFFKMEIPFESEEALKITAQIQEEIYYHALLTSCRFAKKYGSHENFKQTRASLGILQFDMWGIQPSQPKRWESLKALIKKQGLRNSLLVAIAPTATIASIVGAYEAIEPQLSNLFKRETLSGEFIQINKYLVKRLKKEGLWSYAIQEKIKQANGSVQNIPEIPQNIKDLFKTIWEIPQKTLIDRAVARGPYIDQSQSLNLFMENPTINKLSSMYMYGWKQGLKTTYYLRSRPATNIAKVTVSAPLSPGPEAKTNSALLNQLENPEICEACQ